MKDKQKLKNKRFFLLITFLFFTSYATSKIFKNVNYQDVSIVGSELFSTDDIVANSSLNFPTPLIFVKASYTEKELKKNLSSKIFGWEENFRETLSKMLISKTFL